MSLTRIPPYTVRNNKIKILTWITNFACLFIILFFSHKDSFCQPEYNSVQSIYDIHIFRDFEKTDLFYYEPGDIKIACDHEGKPDFTFLSTRYTGTKLGGDQGTSRFSNIIRFRLVMDHPSENTINKIKSVLKHSHNEVKLKPLLIKHLKTSLIYQSLISSNSSTMDQLYGGYVSAQDEKGYDTHSGYWREREYTLRLDNYTSQIFRELLQDGIVLSVGYAFYADFIDSVNTDIQIDGIPEFVKSMHEEFFQQQDSTKADSLVVTKLIKADAFDISIDIKKWPDLVKQIDIGQFAIPPDYAALDIYCFDFNNELRPDLYAKRIEIDAVGVGKGMVSISVTFRRSQPDLYAHTVRFPYAVRVDRPFRYRIEELPDEGGRKIFPWKEKKSWSEILDVTTTTEEFK